LSQWSIQRTKWQSKPQEVVGSKSTTETQDADTSLASSRQQLLFAVLKNSVAQVQYFLEDVHVDPSFVISIGRDRKVQSSLTKSAMLDQVFKMKRILGESPALLHIAILNVYYRCTTSCGALMMLPRQRRAEVDKATQILKLVMDASTSHGQRSLVIFPRKRSSSVSGSVNRREWMMTPTDLAQRILKVTDQLHLDQVETIFKTILEGMNGGDNDEKRETALFEGNKAAAKTKSSSSSREISKDSLDWLVLLLFSNCTLNTKIGSSESLRVTTTTDGFIFLCHEDMHRVEESATEKTIITLTESAEKREPDDSSLKH